MRWAHRYRGMPPVGTTRYRKVFLWLPRVDTDNYWRWLEEAWVKQEWDQGYVDTGYLVVGDGHYSWQITKVMPKGYPDIAVDINGRPVVKEQHIAS